MTINKRILRSVRTNLSFYLASSILTAITVALIIGAFATAQTLRQATEQVYDGYQLESAQFKTSTALSPEQIAALEDAYDVLLEEQLSYDAAFSADAGQTEDTLRLLALNEKLNLADVLAGRLPSADNEALISQRYAISHGVAVGDSISVLGETFLITGYMARPDYLYCLQNTSDPFGNYDTFGLLGISRDALNRLCTPVSEYAVVYLDPSMEKEFRKAVYELAAPTEYIAATANPRISLPLSQPQSLQSEFTSYAIILFLLVVVLLSLMLSRMVRKDSRNIGTLLALGYRKKELVSHYAVYSLIPAVIGGLLGVLISIPFTRAFSAYFMNDLEQVPYQAVYPYPVAAAALTAPVLLYLLSAIVILQKNVKTDIIPLLKSGSKSQHISKLFASGKGSFQRVYTLRVLCGNLSRSLVFILGMTVACLIILLGGICQDSQQNLLRNKISAVTDARYETALKDFHTQPITSGETLIDVNFGVSGRTKGFNLVGYDEDNVLLKRNTLSGEPTEYGKYYMTRAAASYYGVQPGDSFTFYHQISMEETTVEIADIIDNDIMLLLLTSKDNAAQIVGVSPDSYNNIISKEKQDLPDEEIQSITDLGGYRDKYETLLSSSSVVYKILLVVGVIICVLLVNLLSGMVLDENTRNISMLKVLGYRNCEIQDLVLRPHHLLVPVCYLLSIPLTLLLTQAILSDTVENSGVYIDTVVQPSTLVIYFVIVLASYAISLLFAARKLQKVDMVESLKEDREG